MYDQARLRRDSVPADVRPTTEKNDCRRRTTAGYPPKVGRAMLIGAALGDHAVDAVFVPDPLPDLDGNLTPALRPLNRLVFDMQ